MLWNFNCFLFFFLLLNALELLEMFGSQRNPAQLSRFFNPPASSISSASEQGAQRYKLNNTLEECGCNTYYFMKTYYIFCIIYQFKS